MGVDIDVVSVFGVEYSYDELENFMNHPDTIVLANDIGVHNYELYNIWGDSGDQYIISSPYYDADTRECTYLFGYEIENCISPIKMHSILEKENEIKKQIKEFCEKYNVVNKEIKIINLPNVW
jgi:hypothetical protein